MQWWFAGVVIVSGSLFLAEGEGIRNLSGEHLQDNLPRGVFVLLLIRRCLCLQQGGCVLPEFFSIPFDLVLSL